MTKRTKVNPAQEENNVPTTTIFQGRDGVTKNLWSQAEKTVIVKLYKEAPLLPYPLVVKETRIGTKEMVYDIPKEAVVDFVEKLWPWCDAFNTTPGYYTDLHSGKKIDPQEIMILRHEKRNIPVCPDYSQTGGMVVDFVETSQLEESTDGLFYCKKAKQGLAYIQA